MMIMTSVSIKTWNVKVKYQDQGQNRLELAYYCFSHWSIFKKLKAAPWDENFQFCQFWKFNCQCQGTEKDETIYISKTYTDM